MDIASQEKEIIELLSSHHNHESLLRFLIGRGRTLAHDLPTKGLRQDEHLVAGCLVKVWLAARCAEGRVWFSADADSQIARGIVSLFLSLYDGRRPEEILAHRSTLAEHHALQKVLTKSKRSGLARLSEHMEALARGLHEPQTANAPRMK